MKIFITFLLVLSLIYEGITLSDGRVNICDETILQQSNVNPTTCSSNFAIISSTVEYTINEPIHITIRSNVSDATFIGIHLLAQDDKNTNVGNWKTTDPLLESTSCGSLKHNSEVKKNSVDAFWQASSNVIGQITIKAIIIENGNTVYVDCYNIILIPRVPDIVFVTDPPPNTTTTSTTTMMTTSTTETTLPTTTGTSTATTETTLTTTTDTSTATPTMTTTVTATQSTTTMTQPVTTTVPSGNTTTLTPSPGTDFSVNVTWTYDAVTKITSVQMIVNNLKAGQWVALGLGNNTEMSNAHVFFCKRFTNDTVVLQRYINPAEHHYPQHAGSDQGGTMTPIQQQFSNGVVICEFTLSNFAPQKPQGLRAIDPLSQSKSYHPLFATGSLNATNDPQKHADGARTGLSDVVQLDKSESLFYKPDSSSPDSSMKYLRAHGIIMVFAWILLASTGIVISRYFKNAWTNRLICGKAAWFAGHRFLMSLTAILTMLGFLFILVVMQGTWVNKSDGKRAYAHSITGVIVISLAFFQPFIALFRCEPDSRYRSIFNYVHGFVGFSSYILAITTLFLATYFHLFKNNTGRILMIIWIIWLVLIFAVFEYLQSYIKKKYGQSSYTNINSNTTIGEIVDKQSSTAVTSGTGNEQGATSEEKIKNVLLAFHVLIALILSIVLATQIG